MAWTTTATASSMTPALARAALGVKQALRLHVKPSSFRLAWTRGGTVALGVGARPFLLCFLATTARVCWDAVNCFGVPRGR